jgi:hypothetical protein
MMPHKEDNGRLQDWILVEAYRHGECRRTKAKSAVDFWPEETGDYWIHRDHIYRRYFRLTEDGTGFKFRNGRALERYREARLKSAVIFCDSVRALLRSRLIRFPKVPFSRNDHSDLRPMDAGRLFLTAEGVRRAKSLLSGFRCPRRRDPLDAWRAAL